MMKTKRKIIKYLLFVIGCFCTISMVYNYDVSDFTLEEADGGYNVYLDGNSKGVYITEDQLNGSLALFGTDTTVNIVGNIIDSVNNNNVGTDVGGMEGHHLYVNSINDNVVNLQCENGSTVTVGIVGSESVSVSGPPPFVPDPGIQPVYHDPDSQPAHHDPDSQPVQPEPDPQPTVTISTSYGGACSSYISSWSRVRDNCIASYAWNNNGTTHCSQSYTWTPVYSSCGTRVCVTTTTCYEGGGCSSSTSCSCDASGCPSDAPKPSDGSVNINIKVNLNNPISSCQNIYANDHDECNVKLTITGHPNGGKNIVWTGNDIKRVDHIQDDSGIKSKIVGSSSYNALDFSDVSSNGIQGNGTNFSITINGIKAYTPFSTDSGKIKFKLGGTEMTVRNVKYKFLKPYVGNLEIIRGDGENDILRVGVQQRYKVTASKMDINTNITGLNIYNLANSFNVKPENLYKVQETTGEKYISIDSDSGYAIVDATINYKGSTTMLTSPEVQINPIISYKINGVPVSYYLSPEVDSLNNPLTFMGNRFIGVKVIGLSQGHGKQKLTGGPLNSSNVLLYSVRNKIRKKALRFIESLRSGEISNNVKYIEGNIKASEINGDIATNKYETLVIKNGNLIIDTNLNLNGKKLGIIVLRDNPDDIYDFDKGNILVEPNVTYINALLYADGSLLSTDENGNILSSNTVERNTKLKKQLIFKGRLIVRNTIGGAILGGESKFMLPGGRRLGEGIENFEKAMIYDLNYIRTGNEGWDKNNNGVLDNGEYKEPFVLIYDPDSVLDPPPLFEF